MKRAVFGGEGIGLGDFASARFALLPAPLEQTVSYGTGTGAGPAAILRASEELEFFDEESRRPYWQPGEVHTLPTPELPADPEAAVAAITAAARPAVQEGKFLLTLGGEHTVTVGAVAAVAEKYRDLGVLVVDAHLDLRESYGGTRWSHACVCRRILDTGQTLVWCGSRSFSEEEALLVQERQLQVFYAHELDPEGHWIRQAVQQLPENVYLSIDVDGLDPASMPGTGTPEPGGLSYRQLLALIRETTQRRTLVAADLTEVAPIPHQQVTEFTAARLAAKIIAAVRAGSEDV